MGSERGRLRLALPLRRRVTGSLTSSEGVLGSLNV